MNRRRALCAISLGTAALLAVAGAPAGADVAGPSNFRGFAYPSHDCGPRPQVPQRSGGLRSYVEAQDYNARIEDYNRRSERYSACIADYIDRAKLDMERIHEKQLEAVQDSQ